MLINQTSLFLIFTVNGIIIGIIFDIFRILRRTIKTSDFFTYIEDFLFWLLTGVLLLYSIFTYNNGELRFFMFLAAILGFLVYMLTVSPYLIKINVKIINIIKKVTIKFFTILFIPFIKIFNVIKKILYRPILFIIINIRKNIKSSFTKTKYKIKNDNKLSNTHKTAKKTKHKIANKKILQKRQKDAINLQKN